ncbi:MAG: hypothetical protein AAFP81_16175 [Pseudomonadota bacterium]
MITGVRSAGTGALLILLACGIILVPFVLPELDGSAKAKRQLHDEVRAVTDFLDTGTKRVTHKWPDGTRATLTIRNGNGAYIVNSMDVVRNGQRMTGTCTWSLTPKEFDGTYIVTKVKRVTRGCGKVAAKLKLFDGYVLVHWRVLGHTATLRLK